MLGYKMKGFPPCEDKDKTEDGKYAVVYEPIYNEKICCYGQDVNFNSDEVPEKVIIFPNYSNALRHLDSLKSGFYCGSGNRFTIGNYKIVKLVYKSIRCHWVEVSE